MEFANTDHITPADVERIRSLNAVTNNGRGSAVVRSMLVCFDRGNPSEAAKTLYFEYDKLRQYPEMCALLDEVFRVSYRISCRLTHSK